ncbi:hypothetical protein CK203_048473 [Vitis vinifera]|uniref:DUF4283 domain-containing protein n=1 Tax=Vitis vinifera TaxID=29760 RepID=A0A438H2U3_VITVI|nr:hypothetical protein CK203_048473 [Vitis vinifera]
MENDRIYKFLIGLNVKFDEVKGKVIDCGPLPSLGKVFAKVRREESNHSVMLKKKWVRASIENFALVVVNANANRTFNNQRRAKDKPHIWCDFCNKPYHTRETCWKIHGKPTNWKSNKPEDRYVHANEVDVGPFSKE